MNVVATIDICFGKQFFYLQCKRQKQTDIAPDSDKGVSYSILLRICHLATWAWNPVGPKYWARKIENLGHEVRRVHPNYVKAYLPGSKNDVSDTAAIYEVVQCFNMRFVTYKSPEQTDIQCLHRIRQGYVRFRQLR